MDVQLKTRTLDGVSILEVAGELDIYTSPKLKAAIQTALTTRTSLVVNLLRTTYLDSTALSVLTTAQKQAREAGGNLGLVYDQPQIEKIFTITGLQRVFPIFRTETEAVNTARSWVAAVPPKRT